MLLQIIGVLCSPCDEINITYQVFHSRRNDTGWKARYLPCSSQCHWDMAAFPAVDVSLPFNTQHIGLMRTELLNLQMRRYTRVLKLYATSIIMYFLFFSLNILSFKPYGIMCRYVSTKMCLSICLSVCLSVCMSVSLVCFCLDSTWVVCE